MKKLFTTLIFVCFVMGMSAQTAVMTRGDSLVALSTLSLQNNDIAKAIEYAKEACVLQEQTYGKESMQYDMASSNLAFAYFMNKQYKESAQLRQEQLSYYKKLYGTGSSNYAMVANMLSSCYLMDKDYVSSIKYGEIAVDTYSEVAGKESSEYKMSLNTLVYAYAGNGDFDKAIHIKEIQRKESEVKGDTSSVAYGDILLELCRYKISNGDTTSALSDGLKSLALYERAENGLKIDRVTRLLKNIFRKKKDYAKLVELNEYMLGYYSKHYGASSEKCGDCLKDLCRYCPLIERKAQAIDYGKKALDIYYGIKGDNSIKYDIVVDCLTNIYEDDDSYSEIYALKEKQLARTVEVYGADSEEYASVLEDMALIYSISEEHDKAIEYIEKAVDVVRRIKGEKSQEYADVMSNRVNIMKLAGRHGDSKEMAMTTLKDKERLLSTSVADYVKQKYEIAQEYAYYEQYHDAIRNMEDIIAYQDINKSSDGEKAKALETLSDYRYKVDDYTGCLNLIENALKLREKNGGMEYVMTLIKLANVQNQLGEYANAIETGEKAVELLNKISTEEAMSMRGAVLSTLSSSYSSLGNKRKAGMISKEMLLLAQETGEDIPDLVWMDVENDINGGDDLAATNKEVQALLVEINNTMLAELEAQGMENTSDYANCLITGLGATYIYMKDFTTAKISIERGMKIFENGLGTDNMNYETALELCATCQEEIGEYENAKSSLLKALDICKKVLPKNHPNILSVQTRIAMLNYKMGNPDAVLYTIDATEGLRELMPTSFTQLTIVERNLYWNKFKDWFEKYLPAISEKFESDTMVGAAYNGVLLSKGLLLNSEMEFSHLIAESGDDNLLNKYYKLRMLRSQLTASDRENSSNIDSLLSASAELEKELIRESKVYGDYTKNLSVNWQQVQQRLGDGDIAVEFVSFPLKDDVVYSAFVISKESIVPKKYTLFREKELDSIKGDIYATQDISLMLWKPIIEEYKNVENVYFAPSGKLYSMAIESVPDWKDSNQTISERYKMHRLSSTRFLAVTKEQHEWKEGVVYGGLNYEADEEDFELHRDRYVAKRSADIYSYSSIDSSSSERASIQLPLRLPGTKIEADSIVEYLRISGAHAALYDGSLGTEATFKNLSGNKINVMHIGTHGFFSRNTDSHDINGNEDKAMSHSGLLFSGANHTLRGKAVPEGLEDGILTANEISHVDLRGLDFVVLSACQTGLGEISGEGVFGLQRGFKKAGAKSILMSLWKVDDKATQLLMIRFYHNLISKMNKTDALYDAQKYVREYSDKGASRKYQHPRYWAGFILLDATE